MLVVRVLVRRCSQRVCVLVRRCSQRVRAVGVWKCAVAVSVEDVGARGASVFGCFSVV